MVILEYAGLNRTDLHSSPGMEKISKPIYTLLSWSANQIADLLF